jgi:hypothetical protein
MNINDPPVVVSEYLTEAKATEVYIHRVIVEDQDNDTLSFTATTLPDWISISPGNQDALLYGVPSVDDIGIHAVLLEIRDQEFTIFEGFTIKVSAPTGLGEGPSQTGVEIFPNPANQFIVFRLETTGELQLKVFDATGTLKHSVYERSADQLEMDLAGLPKGIYVYRLHINGQERTGKFIKN